MQPTRCYAMFKLPWVFCLLSFTHCWYPFTNDQSIPLCGWHRANEKKFPNSLFIFSCFHVHSYAGPFACKTTREGTGVDTQADPGKTGKCTPFLSIYWVVKECLLCQIVYSANALLTCKLISNIQSDIVKKKFLLTIQSKVFLRDLTVVRTPERWV